MNEATYALIGMGLGILGTILGGVISLINTQLTNKSNLKIEKIKMHEGARINAYKNLLNFSHSICHDCNYLDGEIARNFLRIMRAKFYKEIFPNYLYYSKKIRGLLTELKDNYDFWGNPDVFDEQEADNFLNHKLIQLATELQDISIKEANV